MAAHTARFMSLLSPLSGRRAAFPKTSQVALAAVSASSVCTRALFGANTGQKRNFAHGAGTDLTVACRTSTTPRLNNGPTTSMNLFTAINSAMHIALETDPTCVPTDCSAPTRNTAVCLRQAVGNTALLRPPANRPPKNLHFLGAQQPKRVATFRCRL